MGQKVNPNIFRLGINQLWKSESGITQHKKSSLKNLYVYLTLKNEFMRHQFLMSNFKIKNYTKTYETLIQVLLYFRIKKIRQRYKWWRRFKKKNILKIKFTLKSFFFLLKKYKKKKKYFLKKTQISTKFYNNFFFILDKKKKKKSIRFKIKKFYIKKFSFDNKKKKFIRTWEKKKKFIKMKNKFKTKKIAIKLEKKLQMMYNQSIKIEIINVLKILSKRNKKINNKIFKQLFKFKKNPALKDFITIISLCLKLKQTALLSEFLSIELQKTKRLAQTIKMIKEIVKKEKKYFNIKGFKLSMWGKLNKAGRSKKRIINLGDLNFQTLNQKLNQSLVHCKTRYGVIGIKFSIIY